MANNKDITNQKGILREIKKAVRQGRTVIFQQVNGNFQPCGEICEPFVSKKAIAYFNALTYRNAKAVTEVTGTLYVKFRY
jgi:hypothetical protein